MRSALTLCAVVLLCGAVALGATPQERFAEAQALFDAAQSELAKDGDDEIAARKQLHEAARRFAELADEGIASVNLYMNAGNAYQFSGDSARALLWYLRAHQLANTAETRTGLAALRAACRAEQWPHDAGSIGRVLMFWHYDLGQRLKQWVLIATYPVGVVLLIVAAFVRRRTVLIRTGVAFMIIGAAIGISDVVTTTGGNGHWAVVLESGAGYAGDGESYSTVVDRIPPGQEVKVIERRDQWVHVALPSGATCWVRASICEEV